MPNNTYNAQAAVDYAHEWAFKRNNLYTNFDSMGGDCTNFISQCLFAGSKIMNYTPDTGWFYISLKNRSAAWAGVKFLYNFLVGNTGRGPYGSEVELSAVVPGDVIQLSFDGSSFSHSLLVVETKGLYKAPQTVFIATHTQDSDNRSLSSYMYKKYRCIHIEGVRT